MYFMNEIEVESVYNKYCDHDILGPAVTTLANLMEWANDNSDGWAYWPKPARAAKNLMMLVERQIINDRQGVTGSGIHAAEVRRALAPIKAFRTRQAADFKVVSP